MKHKLGVLKWPLVLIAPYPFIVYYAIKFLLYIAKKLVQGLVFLVKGVVKLCRHKPAIEEPQKSSAHEQFKTDGGLGAKVEQTQERSYSHSNVREQDSSSYHKRDNDVELSR